MNTVRTALIAVAVIASAVLVSIPERAGADGPPPGAIEIVIEDEPDEDASIGTIPDDPEPAAPEAPPSAPPKPDTDQPTAGAPAGKPNPPAAAPPQAQKPAAPVVRVAATPPLPPAPCRDGKPHDGGKDGVVPASGNTNDDCDHSVKPSPEAGIPAPPAPAEVHASGKPAEKRQYKPPKPKVRTKAIAPRVVYVQPAGANTDPNAPRAGYCHDGKFYDLISGQPSWDPNYAGFTPAVNGSCPMTSGGPAKVVVLQPPPADPGTSRAGYCLNGKYADLLVDQPNWDPQWAGATPAKNGRC